MLTCHAPLRSLLYYNYFALWRLVRYDIAGQATTMLQGYQNLVDFTTRLDSTLKYRFFAPLYPVLSANFMLLGIMALELYNASRDFAVYTQPRPKREDGKR